MHHTRKASSEDFVDDLSGTLGLAGSADYLLVLRRKRQSNEATFQITGRDAPEGEYAVTIEGGNWILAGKGLTEAATTAVNRRNESQLGDRALDVYGVVNTRAVEGTVDLRRRCGGQGGNQSAPSARLPQPPGRC